MKKIILVLLLATNFANISSAQEGIKFENGLSWAEVKAKAKKEKKYIFLDVYTTWCTPCKVMDQQVLSRPEVGSYFNDKFISVRVQGDKTKNDSDYIKSWYLDAAEINSNFIKVYPTYVFLSPDADPVYKITGLQNHDLFLEEAKKSLIPKYQFNMMLKEYDAGKRSPDFVLALARKAKDLGLNSKLHRITNSYINNLTFSSLKDSSNVRLIYEFTDSIRDNGFKLMLRYGKEFCKADPVLDHVYIKYKLESIIRNEIVSPSYEKKITKDLNGQEVIAYNMTQKALVDLKLKLKPYGLLGDKLYKQEKTTLAGLRIRDCKIFENSIRPFLDTNPSWKEVLNKIAEQNAGDGDEWLIGNSIIYYLIKSTKDKEHFLPLIVEAQEYYMERFPHFLNANSINERAWYFFEWSDNTNFLIIAQKWAQQASELEPSNSAILDTYANLTYKIGDVKKALELCNRVIKLSPNDQEFKRTLVRIRNGQPTWPMVKNGELVSPE